MAPTIAPIQEGAEEGKKRPPDTSSGTVEHWVFPHSVPPCQISV